VIAIVDDDEINRHVLKLLVSQISDASHTTNSFFFIEAENGYEAFNKIKLFPEREIILFTDINMPIMDGTMLINLIHENVFHFIMGIKIIVNSSISEAELIDKVEDRSLYNYFISKPAKIVEIKKALKCTNFLV